ncbi:MAG: glycosyltransferase [Lacibacter sp.]
MTRVLIAPLDWGLGHATRCIPLIRYLLQRGVAVELAADGAVAALLQQEFPQLPLHRLPGYGIRYGRNGVLWPLLRQLPRIFRRIRYEHRWLAQLLLQRHFDAVISDNRPGLHHPSLPCVYLTHQLRIRSGWGLPIDYFLQGLHARFLRRFTRVWVPDAATPPWLAGVLAHPPGYALPVQYLGPLSRFAPPQEPLPPHAYELLCLLSGPEPQRSLLEQRILAQVDQIKGRVLLVRGLPGSHAPLQGLPPHVMAQNHLPAGALQQALLQSRLVLCRSGYTSVMDLLRLNKTAVLVPTPGQPEQEYLARWLQQQQLFAYVPQQQLQLHRLSKLCGALQRRSLPPATFEQFTKVVDGFLATLAPAAP